MDNARRPIMSHPLVHAFNRWLMCRECGVKYAKPIAFIGHFIERHCSNEKSDIYVSNSIELAEQLYHCNPCNLSLPNTAALFDHIKAIHMVSDLLLLKHIYLQIVAMKMKENAVIFVIFLQMTISTK
jgi:hypothetical protein